MPIYTVEDAAREDHVITRHRWQPMEGDDRLGPEAELLRAEPPVPVGPGRETDEVGAVARAVEVRVHRDLQVRLLEALEFLRDNGHPHGLAAQMVAQAFQQWALGHLGAVDDVVQEALEEKP